MSILFIRSNGSPFQPAKTTNVTDETENPEFKDRSGKCDIKKINNLGSKVKIMKEIVFFLSQNDEIIYI